MKIKQYLPEQDYVLPDIDILSLIFGRFFPALYLLIQSDLPTLRIQTPPTLGQMKKRSSMLKQQIPPIVSQKRKLEH